MTARLWVAWRLERTTLLIMGGLIAVFAAWLVVRGLHIHSIAQATRSCRRRPFTPACYPGQFRIGSPTATAGPILANLLPLVGGMFVGAPMFARDFEAGTQRFALTQGTGRIRWVVSRLALTAAVCLPLASLLGLLTWWWLAPYRSAAFFGGGPWAGGRDLAIVTPVLLTGWTLLGLAVGVTIGLLLRRTLRAIAATGTLMAVLMVLAVSRLRPLLLGVDPLRVRNSSPLGTYTVATYFTGPNGRILSDAALNQLVAHIPPKVAAANTELTWYAARHVYFWLAYQPASRYWLFQFTELGVLLVVSALLVVLTLRIARRAD
ncbi:MAG TPA: hypothetical protein VK836_08450 [Streptosporangiaceae bacterium]|nr:hypothetical protein [Streptosporangiaceae bacterium]